MPKGAFFLTKRKNRFLAVTIVSSLVIGLFFLLNSLLNVDYSTSGTALISSSSSPKESKLTVSSKSISNNLQKNSNILLLDNLLPLQLNIALRWRFDDIIYLHNETQQTIMDLLDNLAKELMLDTKNRTYLFDLFGRYQDYKMSLAHLKKNGPAIEQSIDMNESRAFVNLIHEQQLTYFNNHEIEAFFGKDNAYDKQALMRLAIRRDQSLSPEGKTILLLNQINQMDEEERQVYLPSLQAADIAEYITGNSDSMPVSTAKANERIEKTRQDKKEWEQRIKKYQRFYINNKNKNLTSAERKTLLKVYLNDNFTQNELKRLSVFIKHPNLFKTKSMEHP